AKTAAPDRIQDAVANPWDLRHFRHVVDAHDMRPDKNAGRHRCGGGPEALLGRRWSAVPDERRAEKTFARCAHQRRAAELRQLWRTPRQLVEPADTGWNGAIHGQQCSTSTAMRLSAPCCYFLMITIIKFIR